MKAISKYFMFAAAALLCALLLSSCNKETSNPAGEDGDASSSVCFSYSISAIEGSLPDVKSSTGVSYADFLAKIKTGELVAPSYSLTLTDKSSGESISVSGNWAEKKKVTLHNGTYKVTGTSTAEGRTLQDKCSIKIDDEITVPSASGEVVLKASYDCFLLVFGDNSISEMSLFDGEQSSDFFKMGDSFYAFGRGSLSVSGKEKDAYISCTRSDGSSFNISTENMTLKTGKYYVYGEINSDEGFSFEIEDIEPGVVESVSLDITEYTFSKVGDRPLRLRATVLPESATNKALEWTSSDTNVAQVSQTGVVESVGDGTATITVSATDGSGKSATCTVHVALFVYMNQESLSLMVGQSATLTATVVPESASDKTLTWTSSDEKIATVDDKGMVTAKSKGTAIIKASVSKAMGRNFGECLVSVFSLDEDLGLSVKWATGNLSENGLCENPWDYGDYYAWGETSPNSKYHWSTYIWCHDPGYRLTKYCNVATCGYQGFTDEKTTLDPEDDAAYVKLDGKWRMPTAAEWAELMEKCTREWVANYNGSGNAGFLVTASNGNCIFLPAAGYRYSAGPTGVGSIGSYWTSSLYTDNPIDAQCFGFESPDVIGSSYPYGGGLMGIGRDIGCRIRPVCEKEDLQETRDRVAGD